MSYNKLWSRWIESSIFKHLGDNVTEVSKIYIEGMVRDTNKVEEYLEFRMDGPWVEQKQSGYVLEYDINVLVTLPQSKNLYRKADITGELMQILSGQISILDQTQTIVGCSKLKTDRRQKLQTNNFGIVKPASTLMQSTVEARHYWEVS